MSDDDYSLDADLCQASLAAYSAPASFVVSDVHVVVSTTHDLTVIAFRGTVPTSWQDWFRDFAAWPEQLLDHPSLGPCHAGFVSGAEDILPKVRPILWPSRPFAVTGHSLGGALAIAAGAMLMDCGLIPARVTTFGAPRVGMAKLAEKLRQIPGRRYRHGDDPVPEVPTWPYLTDRGWTRIGDPGPDPIGDHAIEKYFEALQQVAVG
jgi:hypothetical protein